MRQGEIERAQIHYITEISLEDYKKTNDFKKMRKLFELCGTGNKILDVGSGGGYIGRILKDNGNDVTYLDLQEAAVRDARKKGLKAVVGKAQRLPFPNESFDIVIMPEVIEHFLETDKALQESRRVLRPKGALIITTPNFASFRDRVLLIFGKLQAYAQHNDHIKFFNKERLSKSIRANGFRLVKVYGSGFSIPVPHDALLFFFLDRVLPTTLLECLIAYARKK